MDLQNWIDQQREGHKEDRRLKKALENTTELKDAVNELLIFMEDDPKIILVPLWPSRQKSSCHLQQSLKLTILSAIIRRRT